MECICGFKENEKERFIKIGTYFYNHDYNWRGKLIKKDIAFIIYTCPKCFTPKLIPGDNFKCQNLSN